MATIVKTPSGTWKAVVRRRGWPTTIKTFRTKRDAEDWARGVEDEIVRGIYIQRSGSERMTLDEALDRYLREVSSTKRPSTRAGEEKRSKVLRENFGPYALAAVSPHRIAKYRDTRIDEGKSNNSVRLELALLSHLFTTAIREWGLGLTFNPVANVRKPSPGRGRNRRLSPGEEIRLLAALDRHSNPMLGWIVRIALHTGMRKGEILSLRRDQVDLGQRVARLERTKNGDSRLVPLSREAVTVFSEALRHPMHELVVSPLLFFGEPGKDGERRPYVISKVWAAAVTKAALDDFHFHDLRHEAVSRFVEAGLSDQQVSAISGHRSMQMLKRYTHLRSQDLVAELDRALS